MFKFNTTPKCKDCNLTMQQVGKVYACRHCGMVAY